MPFVCAAVAPPATLPLAPLPGAVNVTVTPATGLPPASFTVATSGAANAVLIVALCGVPLVAVMLAAAPAVFVSEKSAGVATPATLARSEERRVGTECSVQFADVASPMTLVVAVFTPAANLPRAPLHAALLVTCTPAIGSPPPSFTVATSGAANAVLIVALCGVPLVAVMLAAAAAVFVSEKSAGVATPATLAVTVYGPPATVLAVKVADVATPLPLVVAVFTPPAKLPLAPVADAVNVTVTLATGLPPASFTVATSGAANARKIIRLNCVHPV